MKMDKELRINRDNDKFAKFILGDYSWNIYHKGLEINAYDNNHIFSFFGENGVGKSSICRKIWNAKRYSKKPEKSEIEKLKIIDLCLMDINYFINADLDSACVFYTSEKSNKKFSDFFGNIFDIGTLIENARYNKKVKEEKDVKKHKEFSDERIRNLHKLYRKYHSINKIIHNYFTENNLNVEFMIFKKSGYILSHAETDNTIHHIVDIIDAFTNFKKISVAYFFKSFHKYEKELEEYDESNYTSILSGNKKSLYIRNFLSDILAMVKEINIEYKKEIKFSIKAINYIEKNLLEEFLMISNSFIKEIYIETQYNSLLDIEYKKIFIIKNDGTSKRHEVKDFLNVISEGQKKLIKYLFVLADIAIRANNKTIILADDIFDSFDNKNVINILMLLSKVLKIKKPILLIFTHDFEIFGLINKKLDVKKDSSYIMEKTNDKINFEVLSIKQGTLEEYIKNKKNFTNTIEIKVFYFLILTAYGRNLIQRTKGVDDDYIKITSLMHIKKDSLLILNKCSQLYHLKFLDFFEKEDIIEIENYASSFNDYFELIETIFNYIKVENFYKIEYNIFLSLYSRLLIENEIIKRTQSVEDKELNLVKDYQEYQTGKLLLKYKNIHGDDDFCKKLNLLNEHIIKFIHIEHGLSYLINIDSKILLKLITNIKN